LSILWNNKTSDHLGQNPRHWAAYSCVRCGGVVLGSAGDLNQPLQASFPDGGQGVESDIPSPARDYLEQAIDSQHAPAGSVMLAASAVDAMLKAKGFKDGSLYSRIDKSVAAHLLTAEMGKWAHQVRLEANDQRHADEAASLPTAEDARRSVDFARALASFLFVLPARVSRGIEDSKPSK